VRRLSTESAGDGEKRRWLTGLILMVMFHISVVICTEYLSIAGSVIHFLL